MERIKSIHFDMTDLCNAGCPQCARTDPNGCLPRSWLKEEAVSLADFKRFSPPALLEEIDSAYFCGNFGDPAIVPEMLEILAWCWEVNPKLGLKLYSNCSVRSKDWWQELGQITKEREFSLIAAIDGASDDTNKRYRVRTDFGRIVENTSAFINAGGKAEWRMLVFRHNEHEVEAAQSLAEELGFASFRSYPSSRFGASQGMSYTHKEEEFTLQPPTEKLPPQSTTTHTIFGKKVQDEEIVIECEALRTSSVFVDFLGYLTPCCHIGRRLYMREQGAFGASDTLMGDVFDTFDAKRLNVDHASYAAARQANTEFIEHLKMHWKSTRPTICRNICGKKRPAPKTNV